MASKRPDLKPLVFDELSWTDEGSKDSLKQLIASSRKNATDAIDWYLLAKKSKKYGALFVRAAAIVFTSLGGLMPVLAQIYDGEPAGTFKIEPAWIAVVIAIGLAFLGFDRFFGLSRGWARYITTGLKISSLLGEFNMSWPKRIVTWDDGKPNDTQLQEAIQACTSFVDSIGAIIAAETEEWVTDFQTSLRSLEAAAKAAKTAAEAHAAKQTQEEAAKKPGALNVEVTNGDQFADGWTLAIDGKAQDSRTGKTASVGALDPGIHQVVVKDAAAGGTKRAETSVNVEAGKPANCSLILE